MTSIKHNTRLAALIAAAGACVVTAGCSTYNSLTGRVVQHITPYRVTVVQGNFVSSDAAAKLRVGMTRDEVKTTLGTPLLTDMFHPDRWDYVFYFRRGSRNIVQERDLVVNFNGDHLASWSGAEDLPSNLDLISLIDGTQRESNLLREREARNLAAGQAPASAPTAAAPASGASQAQPPSANSPATPAGEPANQRAADTANIATSSSAPATPGPARSVPQSVVRAGPSSQVNATPEPQFHFSPPSHLRPAGGGSLLAQPPSVDSSSSSSSPSTSSGTSSGSSGTTP